MSPLHRCAGQGPGVREVAQCPKEAGDLRRHWADLHLFRPHSVSEALDPHSGACPGSCFSGDWTDLQLCARQQVTLCLYLFFFFQEHGLDFINLLSLPKGRIWDSPAFYSFVQQIILERSWGPSSGSAPCLSDSLACRVASRVSLDLVTVVH